jgi:hypothetical protein
MALFLVLHTIKTSPEEYAAFATPEVTVSFAQAMASGQTPARCLKTWDSMRWGIIDPSYCLWEAESADDIQATLDSTGLLNHLTADIRPVEETDWAAIAASAS